MYGLKLRVGAGPHCTIGREDPADHRVRTGSTAAAPALGVTVFKLYKRIKPMRSPMEERRSCRSRTIGFAARSDASLRRDEALGIMIPRCDEPACIRCRLFNQRATDAAPL